MEATPPTSTEGQSNEKPSQTVVELVANLEGTNPVELNPPLYSAVDPETLDALFHSSRNNESQTPNYVCFTYLGHEIRVSDDGEVSLIEAKD